jgi:uncharacterized membrane protein (UPF0127 family)
MTAGGVYCIRALLLALLLATPSCKTEPASATAEPYTVELKIGTETFHVEVADTVKKQQLGLMHRKTMAADHGMLFVFPDERERSFWMKNTHIPLDIIYADAKGKVVSIKQMQPLDESPVPSDGPARYAVEINQGAAKRAGVKAGDVLVIPPEVRESGDGRSRDR